MTALSIRLIIAGIDLPVETHYRACTVQIERHTSGRRRLDLRASGQYAPSLAGIDWTAAVSVQWRDLTPPGTDWAALSLLSAGPTITADLAGLGVDWTLTGWEAPAGSYRVAVGGVSYTGRQSVSPVGGTVQRRSNGAGSLLMAWGKRSVRISAESLSAPSISAGLVSVAGPLYTGSILCRGLTAEVDSTTGLVNWSVEGEEP